LPGLRRQRADPPRSAAAAPGPRHGRPRHRRAGRGADDPPAGGALDGRPTAGRPRPRAWLRNPRRAGPGLDGRGLQGPADGAEAAGRPQDDPGRRPRRRRAAGALPPRGGGGRPVAAPARRPGLRSRRAGGPAVLLAGVRGRRQPGPAAEGPAPRPGPGGRRGGETRPRHARGPPARHRPPRPEARQPPAAGRRRRRRRPRLPQGDRLRAGQAPQRRSRGLPAGGADPARGGAGHPQLHGPRAGRRARRGGRPANRRVCAGRHPLRVAHRPAALPRRHRPAHPRPGAEAGPGAAVAAAAGRPARPGGRLPEGPGQGAGAALHLGPGAGPGPGALPRRRGHPGAAGGRPP
jgi:hypothetical protein